uniref:Thioredoxin domain-containing protein n=1 Tax=Parascaris univalens TaxID=6257 RepID=A0A915A9W2_PARUN
MKFGIAHRKLSVFFYLFVVLPYSSTLDVALSPPIEDTSERDTPTEQISSTRSIVSLPKQCGYPKDAFLLLIKNMCPSADPFCIIDSPFDFLANSKIRCSTALRRENATLQLMSSSQLLHLISIMSGNEDLPLCMLTAFYTPQCIFSARMAPFLNALPRVYPQLHVIACDASEYSRLHSRYGISGTPTIILWLDGIGVARMDDSPFSLEAFKEFIEKWTDLESISSVTMQEADYEGPLPTRAREEQTDWYLWLSSVTMFLSCAYFFSISKYGQSLWQMIRMNYMEANEAR